MNVTSENSEGKVKEIRKREGTKKILMGLLERAISYQNEREEAVDKCHIGKIYF